MATRGYRSDADADDAKHLASALREAKRPVIDAGQRALYSGASHRLVKLAEVTATPVITTLNGKSAFPEDHALALGTGARSRRATVDHFLSRADFILGTGTSFTHSDYITAMPAEVPLAQVTSDRADIGKCYPTSFGAIGDAKLTIDQLLRVFRRKPPNRARSRP